MPQRPRRPCRHKGCRNLHRNANGYCDQHQDDAKAWARKQPAPKTTTERGYGWQWQKLRQHILRRDKYLCQPCLEAGRITEAKDVDHIINKAQGGTDEPENLQAICGACHKAKTQRESMERGGGRSLVGRDRSS